jgi:ATP-dependent Clp protease ATP-binding subunit ClpB
LNLNKFTQRSADAVSYAQQLAQTESHPQVTPLHLLAALLQQDEGLVRRILQKVDVDVNQLQQRVDSELRLLAHQSGGQIYASTDFASVINRAEQEAGKLQDEYVSVEHLLLGLIEVRSKAQELLREFGVDRDSVLKAMSSIRGSSRVTDINPESINCRNLSHPIWLSA